MRPAAALDRLVANGRLSGYTVEADTSYLYAKRPTLTYRMYARHSASEHNLDAFWSAMSTIGAELRASRLVGIVAGPCGLVRTDQICIGAAFADARILERAVALVQDRFTCGPAAVPGSWRFPDLRVSGAAPEGTIAVWAHRWDAAVTLAASAVPPVPNATCTRVRVLASWAGLLSPTW